MIDIATDLREDGDREAVRAEMQEVVDFETKIAEVRSKICFSYIFVYPVFFFI